MSGPKRRRRGKRGLSRRQFIKTFGLGSAALGAGPLLSGCDNSDPAGAGAGPGAAVAFRHGVASGDPLSDRVILWTRVSDATGDVDVDYVVATDPSLNSVVTSGRVAATAARDHTVKVDATGLSPGTTYYYRFSAGSATSPVGRTRTAPAGAVDRLRIGVVSCSSMPHGYFNAYGTLAQRADLDVVVHLGDYIYEYGTGEYGNLRETEPPGEILTLQDYRTRYAQYHRDADLQELHRQNPFILTWDDHETADNSYRDGANNHTEGAEGTWVQRRAWAFQAYDEWLPIRYPFPNDVERIYRVQPYGDLVDLIVLDTRQVARDQEGTAPIEVPGLPVGVFSESLPPFNDPSRTMLGAPQEAWLFDRLANSTAQWKVLVQQVMLGQLKVVGTPNLDLVNPSLYLNPDQWDGYPFARRRVMDFIGGNAIDNVVVLTGDIHCSWAMDLNQDPNNPLSYNPLTGDGSIGVEFVGTSITSPGVAALAAVQDVVPVVNPHMKYIELSRNGYLLLDITPERCQGEYWFVDTILAPQLGESFATALSAATGSNRLTANQPASEPRAGAPARAP